SIDPLALEEAKRLLLASMHTKPLRGRPYFSLAVDVGVWAVWGQEGYASGFADALAALGPAEVAAAAARWLPIASLSRLSFTAGGGGLGSLPEDAEGLAAAGEEAVASGDLPRAIAAYEALLQTGPNRMNTVIYRYYLGDMNFSLGRLEASREHLLAGLAVVDYPALGDLLREVEAALGVEPLPEASDSPEVDAAPDAAAQAVPASGALVYLDIGQSL
ncbi:hypothetical protein IIA16_06855, partial [bacterium]|nr:hypothetical protein [bacterium]